MADPFNATEGDICPQHYYCPSGSDTFYLCEAGYMANNTGMEECELCTAGFLCVPGEAPRICPQGLNYKL